MVHQPRWSGTQSYRPFLAAYDYVALMAMPYLEGSHNPDRFYRELIAAARRQPNGLAKTIFELQTVDWRDDGHVPIPASELRETMRFLQSQGVANLAYYPDDFIGGRPELDELRRGISLFVLVIGHWDLEFICYLNIVIWCFKAFRLCFRIYLTER